MTRKTPKEKAYGPCWLSLSPGLFLSSDLRSGTIVKKNRNGRRVRILPVSLLSEAHMISLDK